MEISNCSVIFTRKKKTSKFNLTLNLRNNLLDNCAMYRRKIWEQVGGYDENMPYMGFEDWEFWINVAKRGWKFYKINKVLFDYRMREDSMLKTAKRDIPDYDNIVKDYMHIKHIRLLRVHYDLLCDYYYALSRLSIMFYLYTFYRKYVKPLIKKS